MGKRIADMTPEEADAARAYARRYYAEHREQQKANSGRWRRANPAKHREGVKRAAKRHPQSVRRRAATYRQRNAATLTARRSVQSRTEEYRKKNRDNMFFRNLRRLYGMTYADYVALFDAQGGRCAICASLFPETRRPSIDHDHSTNVVRGLLCTACNRGLGYLGDDETRLENALRYLRRSRSME